MNILILEDRASTLRQMKEILEEDLQKRSPGNKPDFSCCYSIYKANEVLKTKEIHIVITDLAMSTEGLPPSEIKKTMFGVITGWIWLENSVFPLQKSIQIIIFSEFINDWRDYLRSQNQDEDAIKEKYNITAVPKISPYNANAYNDLLRAIEI